VAQYDLNKSYLYKINRKKNGTTLVLFFNPKKNNNNNLILIIMRIRDLKPSSPYKRRQSILMSYKTLGTSLIHFKLCIL
jgi:hypothetical protein